MKKRSPAERSIRADYQQHGAEGFYRAEGAQYRNPHEAAIGRVLRHVVANWPLDQSHVLDLACGSGEITLALRALGAGRIDGIDPFTYQAYQQRTGLVAGRESFEAIAEGALAGRHYSLIVCSFALHLVAPSRLPLLCFRLGEISTVLLVITPHKRPDLRPEWGWVLAEETVIERVRARLYQRQ